MKNGKDENGRPKEIECVKEKKKSNLDHIYPGYNNNDADEILNQFLKQCCIIFL